MMYKKCIVLPCEIGDTLYTVSNNGIEVRDYLFRGKRVDNGEWVEGFYVQVDNKAYISLLLDISGDGVITMFDEKQSKAHLYTLSPFLEVVPETVGQYTGYDDYFDGDIIKLEQDGVIGVIRFGEYQNPNCSGSGECHLGFSIEWYGKYSDIIRRDLGWWIKAASENIKKIGNIHDNPELLEAKL